MAAFTALHSAMLISILLSLFALYGCDSSVKQEDKISGQKPFPSREKKYPTPCIESIVCNDAISPNGLHLGNCWCCILKGTCYSSQLICTLECLTPSSTADNKP